MPVPVYSDAYFPLPSKINHDDDRRQQTEQTESKASQNRMRPTGNGRRLRQLRRRFRYSTADSPDFTSGRDERVVRRTFVQTTARPLFDEIRAPVYERHRSQDAEVDCRIRIGISFSQSSIRSLLSCV